MVLGLVVEGGEVDGGWEWVKLVVDGRGRRGCWKNLGPSGGGIYMDVETGIKGSEITASVGRKLNWSRQPQSKLRLSIRGEIEVD